MDHFLILNLLQWLVLLIGLLVTFALSGLVVKLILRPFHVHSKQSRPSEAKGLPPESDLGAIIGKCENFLTIILMLADQVTGLAVIFAAKSILRAEDMKSNPRYYLGGTLVNLCFSVLMGLIIYRVLAWFGDG